MTYLLKLSPAYSHQSAWELPIDMVGSIDHVKDFCRHLIRGDKLLQSYEGDIHLYDMSKPGGERVVCTFNRKNQASVIGDE